jgi:cobalt/nickel transport system ATP-binding protein
VEILGCRELRVEVDGRELLKGVNFSLKRGQKLFLLGDNGAGKTTFIETLMGFVKPVSGEVLFKGEPVRDDGQWRRLRRSVGYVFQNPDEQLFCPTVEEELAFAPLVAGKSREETAELIERVLNAFGIEHLRHRPTHKLSGGEKRIVSVAAVLTMEPEALILDEPTVGLDRQRFNRLVEFLEETDKALLVVSHEESLLKRLPWPKLYLKEGKLFFAEDGQNPNDEGNQEEEGY